jgi:hypothetical protein
LDINIHTYQTLYQCIGVFYPNFADEDEMMAEDEACDRTYLKLRLTLAALKLSHLEKISDRA